MSEPRKFGPIGFEYKEYGRHDYDDHDGTSDCKNGCGCWMGPSRSGGPLGIDPGGICPHNPVDGKRLGDKRDYEYVVLDRIASAERRARDAEYRLAQTSPDKISLAENLEKSEQAVRRLQAAISQILAIANLNASA